MQEVKGVQTLFPRLQKLAARAGDRRFLVHLAWIATIFAIAVAVRSFWVAYGRADPTDGRIFSDDALFYHHFAISLSRGLGYINPFTGANTAMWPPGYPFLLTALYRLFGPHVAIAWGANIVLGAFSCVALYMLGCLIAGRRVGAIAALLLAIFPGHVFFSSLVMTEVFFTFLVVVAMVLIVVVGRRRDAGWLWVVLVGLVAGATALVRAQGVLLVVVAGLFWWLSTGDFEKTLYRTVAVAMTCLAVIIPWSIRNYVDMKSFVFLSTNDGENLYIGNHEGATGRFIYGATIWISARYLDRTPEEREVITSNIALREGLAFMFTHPWEEVHLTGSKLKALYDDDGYALRAINAPDVGKPLPHMGMIIDVANGFYFAVLIVSASGGVLWLRRPRDPLALPILVIVIFTLGQLPFFSLSRYHLPLLPAFALLAAAGLVAAVDETKRLATRRARRGSSSLGSG